MKHLVKSLMVAVPLLLAGSGQSYAADTIKIGGLLERSGFLASLGQPGFEGASLAVDQINAAGGIKGKKVEFVNINTESDNTKAVTAIKRLIEREKVVAVVGAMNSGSSYSIISTIQRAKIPVIANGGSRGIVLPPEKKKWIFLAPLTDVLVQSVMMKHMRANGITRIALMNADSGFGTSGKKQLEAHAKSNGIEIVIQETFGNKDQDMTPQLTKVRASKAQATVVWATGPGQAIVTKNYRQLGIKGNLYLSHAATDFNYIRLSGAAAEGIFIPSSKLYVTADLAANDPQKKVIDKFIADYKAKYNKVPATFAGNGYDAMMMILRAVEKAGLDKGKIRNTIEGTKGYVGVTALYDYSPTDHFGARADSVVMLTVKGGTFALAK